MYSKNKKRQTKKYFAFTLVELLIVVSIIGILASVVLVAISSSKDNAREARAQAELTSLKRAIQLMGSDTGQWPGQQTPNQLNQVSMPPNEIADVTDANAGLVSNPGGVYTNWNGPYIPATMVDPWGNPYFFDTDYDTSAGAGTSWDVAVGSYGPNGVGPNLYDSDDIIVLFEIE